MANPLYNFGISQEDERSERAALNLRETTHVVSVCSAGEVPLSLLAMGARAVLAVDIDPAQIHLARLKLAAVCQLERVEAIRFLGYLPAPAAERVDQLTRVESMLPAETRAFWRQQATAVARGVIWEGRYEQYLTRLVKVLRIFLGTTIDRFFECNSLTEQTRLFQRHFDRWIYHRLFALAFHPRVFRKRGMDPRSLAHRDRSDSLGAQYFARFQTMCTAHPARDNHLLQLHLLGRVLSPAAIPAFLSEEGSHRLRKHADAITFVHDDLVTALDMLPEGVYDAFHLSNLPDWIDEERFAEVLRLLVRKSARDGRAVWRFIHIDRPVPPSIAISVDTDQRAALTQTDRFPFYTIVPASIGVVTP